MEEIKTYQDSKNMNERRPKVSVIMPMYNQEKYIAECLTSVIRQSLKDIEIIVVNDGSTDSSLKIVQKIKGDDPRVIIIDKKNSGYGHSLNVGVDAAKGNISESLKRTIIFFPKCMRLFTESPARKMLKSSKRIFVVFLPNRGSFPVQKSDCRNKKNIIIA